MSRLEIRLLGGFDVRNDGRRLAGFESQKVRGLLAYLVCHGRQPLSRDLLADLLWPELDESAGRRNLRQALYNLRSSLQEGSSDEAPPLIATRNSIRLRGDLDLWCDVEAFERVLDAARSAAGKNPHEHLAGAVQLYRGDFLAGFYVKDSPAFEDWLISEQERLREAVIEALQALVDLYLEAGSYSLGVQYAWRLVNLDPLSELAHRQLIRLYALTGRRERALAQYEECRRILHEELGVEPREATTNLYHWVELQDQVEAEPPMLTAASHHPTLELVGRDDELETMLDWWSASEGEGRLRVFLIEGVGGVGKTRLIESMVETLRRRQRVNVLRGQPIGDLVPGGYQPLHEALHSAIRSQSGYVRRALAELSPITLAELTRLFPDLATQRPDLPPASKSVSLEALYSSFGELLEELCDPFDDHQSPVPLILFLDDLHLAGGDTFLLLEHLAKRPLAAPVRLIGSHLPGARNVHGPIEELGDRLTAAEVPIERLTLRTLDLEQIQEIPRQLLGEHGGHPLALYLWRQTGGLPVALQEVIYDRFESGDLKRSPGGEWHWAGNLDVRDDQPPVPLDEVIWERVRRLPRSARRLLMLIAVIGHRFDAELLAQVEGEDLSVVWANLRILIDRMMVRQIEDPWAEVESAAVQQRTDSVGLRVPIEFSHQRLRTVLYRRLDDERRQIMHGQVAMALGERSARRSVSWAATLAHHLAAADEDTLAVRYHQRAAHLALKHPAPLRAIQHCDRALELLPEAGLAEVEVESLRRSIEEAREKSLALLGDDAAPYLRLARSRREEATAD